MNMRKMETCKKGISKYFLEKVSVKLTPGYGAIPGDNTYVNQEELQKQFFESIRLHLEKRVILATNSESASGDLEIEIDYQRNFNHGGKALNKPWVRHKINVYKNDMKLVSLSTVKYTTRYTYFKEIAVNLEIGAFQWGVEDEPEDVNYISDYIVDTIFNLGK